jgi:predicted nucleotidyltransferase
MLDESEKIAEPYRSLVNRLLGELMSAYGDRLVSLVVFGSVARGDARKDSDIDLLLVIGSLPKSRLERQREFIGVEKALDECLDELSGQGYSVSISPILLMPDEASKVSPLYLDMVEDAVIVYDKDGFFGNVLERLRERLKELGSRRIWMGKKWYWVLKPDYRFGDVIRIG